MLPLLLVTILACDEHYGDDDVFIIVSNHDVQMCRDLNGSSASGAAAVVAHVAGVLLRAETISHYDDDQDDLIDTIYFLVYYYVMSCY